MTIKSIFPNTKKFYELGFSDWFSNYERKENETPWYGEELNNEESLLALQERDQKLIRQGEITDDQATQNARIRSDAVHRDSGGETIDIDLT